MEIGDDIQTLSKEPSVRYRGFFINDEWPCFGNWTSDHFGGFNADAYEHVFELLLRLKGNYLWPAMWSASFPIDGPGGANEELAILETRHMLIPVEICLHLFVESQELRYLIPVHILRDQRPLLADDIFQQIYILLHGGLLSQHGCVSLTPHADGDQVFIFAAALKGLLPIDWDELDNVICMLCEDNFGQMRTLPTPEVRNRKGGWGMYYHFDYHGGPISYEWVDSTPMAKTWEQMCMAYEYGIRDAWIVNVGDLKFHEVPLSYFLAW